jgi:hypothetical protein
MKNQKTQKTHRKGAVALVTLLAAAAVATITVFAGSWSSPDYNIPGVDPVNYLYIDTDTPSPHGQGVVKGYDIDAENGKVKVYFQTTTVSVDIPYGTTSGSVFVTSVAAFNANDDLDFGPVTGQPDPNASYAVLDIEDFDTEVNFRGAIKLVFALSGYHNGVPQTLYLRIPSIPAPPATPTE